MLKSYEAIYNNGQLHWLGQMPPAQTEMRMLIVVDVPHSLLTPQETTVNEIPSSTRRSFDLKELWQEWDRQNPGKKPLGGKLRPKLQGKTATQCVLEDRGL